MTTTATTQAELARLNRLLDGPAPFEPIDLQLSAAGMVEIGRDGLSELTGAWTLAQLADVAGLSLCDCTSGGRDRPAASCQHCRGEGWHS